jgi:hypothetical protein
MGQVGTRRI